MPKGSLDKYLSDESSGLDWSTRYNIIEGICYGLCHLHEQMDKPIIHLDLKPANILLHDGMIPKITDFGLPARSGALLPRRWSSRSWRHGLRRGRVNKYPDLFFLCDREACRRWDGGGVIAGDRQGRHRADREHAVGVPQHGHQWVRGARRRQARVHGALLQRQGQDWVQYDH